MRILFFTHYYPPEVNAPATRTYEHCVRWAKAGHDVTVVTCAPNCPDGVVFSGYKNRLLRQVEMIDGVRVIRIWTYIAPNAGTVRRIANYVSYMVSAVLACIRLKRSDVVIATSPQFFCGWAGVFASWLKRSSFVLEIRDIWPESIEAVGALQNRRLLRFLEWLERMMYRSANHIVAVGNGYRDKILEKVAVKDRISVITNGVDLNFFKQREPDLNLLKKWGIQDKFVCSYIGTIGMAHGLEVTLEAAKILKQKGRTDIAFCLVGDGASRERLQEEAKEAGVDDVVIFPGRLPKDQMPSVIASSNACLVHLKGCQLFGTVLPSKIFETMAMGRPVIMGVRGEALNIVLEAKAGLEMEPDSAESLVESVEKIADAPNLATELSQAARDYVAKHYNRDILAKRFAQLLADVTSTKKTSRSPSWRKKAYRWYYILRYYRFSQLILRLISIGKRQLLRITGGQRYRRPLTTPPAIRQNPALYKLAVQSLNGRRARGSSQNAQNIAQGRFVFLNKQIDLPTPIDWRLDSNSNVDHLWRFHLHYHEFILDLLAEGIDSKDSKWFDLLWDIVTDWIENNPLDDNRVLLDAWHPFCISRRLPTWIMAWTISPPDEAVRATIIESMVNQMRFLEDHLELDLQGNHLLENLRAMILVGSFFDGPDADRWLKKGSMVLHRELTKQILPHGEHFERSPMYHALMLQVVLDIRDATAELLPDTSKLCAEAASKMANFLANILHPDHRIPLLSDSCLDESPPEDQLLDRAAVPRARPNQPCIGDYWTYRQGNDFLLFDAGQVGADSLPAHAHADLLTIEASAEGCRFIVDSGVFDYNDTDIRNYCRSTAAHNVIQIDDTDQCDIWSRFRMGYRGHTASLEHGTTGNFQWGRASHDAYKRIRIPKVDRWIACCPDGPWICADRPIGAGKHKLTNRLHFHPDVTVTKTGLDKVKLEVAGRIRWLNFLTPGEISITMQPYCPRFGEQLESPVVTWLSNTYLPAVCVWCISPNGATGELAIDQKTESDVVLLWTENGSKTILRPFD